jgi:hypothetical protein
MAAPQGKAQCSIARSDSRQARCRGRRGRREPRLLPPPPCTSPLPEHRSAVRRLRASGPHPHSVVVAARTRTWASVSSCAWHVPCSHRPLHAPPRSKVRPRVCQRRSNPSHRIQETMLRWDTKPQWDTVDTVQMRDDTVFTQTFKPEMQRAGVLFLQSGCSFKMRHWEVTARVLKREPRCASRPLRLRNVDENVTFTGT